MALSSDFISGFCGETEAEHADTLSLLRAVRYEHAFLFAYSERAKTAAARHLPDDVPPDVKQRRLAEAIAVFREGVAASAAAEVGATHCVLVEGPSRRDGARLTGRTDTNKRVVFDDEPVHSALTAGAPDDASPRVRLAPGDFAAVVVERATAGTLLGRATARTSIAEFQARYGAQFVAAAAGEHAAAAGERAAAVA